MGLCAGVGRGKPTEPGDVRRQPKNPLVVDRVNHWRTRAKSLELANSPAA